MRIGLYADLSATAARDGSDGLRGASLRVADTNAAGGIGGRTVVLVSQDARQSPADAVKAFTALAQEQGVCAVIGFAVASAGIAVSPVADLVKVPFLSLGSDDRVTLPDILTNSAAPVRQYSFLVRPSASQLAAGFAAYATERFPFRRYATLFDPSDALSTLQGRSFEAVIRRAGRVLSASVEIPADGADFSAVLSRISASGAEAVYVCGSLAQNVAFAQALHQASFSLAVLGNQAWDAPLAALAGEAANNAWFATGMAPDDVSLSDLSARTIAAYGEAPRPAVIFGWDAVGLILSAVRKAGSSDPARVRDALEQAAGFRAMQGAVDMDRATHRLSPLPIAVMRILNGQVSTVQARYVAPASLRSP